MYSLFGPIAVGPHTHQQSRWASRQGVFRPLGGHITVLGRTPGFVITWAVVLSAAMGIWGTIVRADSAMGARPRCDGERATQWGDRRDNTLIGSDGRDVIVGRGGNDTILGLGGDDILCGNGGMDTINGNDDEDRIFGGGDIDTLTGATERDKIFGGQGVDFIHGGAQRDKLHGEGDSDIIRGDEGNDVLRGGDGPDELNGGDRIDDCDQDGGSGTIKQCEADIAVEVDGPDTASPGQITFTVTVRNEGPSPTTGVLVAIATANRHLQCENQNFSDGPFNFGALADGARRASPFRTVCVVEGDPPRRVTLAARFARQDQGISDFDDTNNAAHQSTAVN
jgi:hypothetical protein